MPVVLRQPPAIVTAGQPVEEYPLGLKPLRVINADWLEVLITNEQFDAAKSMCSPQDSDAFIMLKMLEVRKVRCKPCTDNIIRELYGYVEAPFIIRKRTVPGFAITCRQGPAKQRK